MINWRGTGGLRNRGLGPLSTFFVSGVGTVSAIFKSATIYIYI